MTDPVFNTPSTPVVKDPNAYDSDTYKVHNFGDERGKLAAPHGEVLKRFPDYTDGEVAEGMLYMWDNMTDEQKKSKYARKNFDTANADCFPGHNFPPIFPADADVVQD